ncbi:hypothetical protein gvb04_00270 [Gardnerella vaginalis]|nr:hypothetical protein gvb04_00270 [Gardnerella vaginalis]
MSSPRRSSASALSGSALRITFSRYALSEKAGLRANTLQKAELIDALCSSKQCDTYHVYCVFLVILTRYSVKYILLLCA